MAVGSRQTRRLKNPRFGATLTSCQQFTCLQSFCCRVCPREQEIPEVFPYSSTAVLVGVSVSRWAAAALVFSEPLSSSGPRGHPAQLPGRPLPDCTSAGGWVVSLLVSRTSLSTYCVPGTGYTAPRYVDWGLPLCRKQLLVALSHNLSEPLSPPRGPFLALTAWIITRLSDVWAGRGWSFGLCPSALDLW